MAHARLDILPSFHEAQAAWQRARVPVALKGALLDELWREFGYAWKLTGAEMLPPDVAPTAAQEAACNAAIGLAAAARKLFEAFGRLSYDEVNASLPILHGGSVFQNPAAEEVLRRHPPLAAWLDERAARAAATDEANRQASARIAAEAIEQAPERLLAGLRGRGVHLALDGKGRLTAPRAVPLTEAEMEGVVHHRERLKALLQAEAEESAPLVIAA